MAAFDKGAAPAGGLAAVQIVRAYWEGLRPAGGGLPQRAALDPRGLSPVLDRVFLAEAVAPGQLRLRIAGMGLTALGGTEMKGLPLSLLFRPDSRPALADACRQVLEGPAVVQIDTDAERGLLRPALSVRLLLLPLAPAETDAARLVLGCLGTEGTLGRTPRPLAIARVAATPLAEPAQAPALPGPSPSRGHLRLVHSA